MSETARAPRVLAECIGGPWDGQMTEHVGPAFPVSMRSFYLCACGHNWPICGWYVLTVSGWVFARELEVGLVEELR